jgi:hypothetical protein
MIRRTTATASATLAALSVILGACSSTDSSTTTADGPTTASTALHQPVDLKPIGAGTPLEPASYAMPLVGYRGPSRVVVDVPDGYFSSGGWFIDDGHGGLAPDEFGNLSFWGAVEVLDPDPCAQGPLVHTGSSVRDLADALLAQRHRDASVPKPVTLGGYRGLYVESRAAGAFERCNGDQHTLFKAYLGSTLWQTDSIRGTVDKLWILDVDGQRVVAAVQVMPGHTADPDELVGIARSARFRVTE